MPITSEQLRSIIAPVQYTPEQLEKINGALNQTFSWYTIDSPLRMAHFLAQVLHESSAFRYTAEIWGPTPAQKRYDTRTDLGNTPDADGDGYLYRGRGWIQLTGKTNYRMATQAFSQDFLNQPDLVQQYPWAALVSGWFWNRRKLNLLADADDFMLITKKVNGGLNGLDDRRLWLHKAKNVLQ
ncbi:MAG: glycoside hydrolase family 19 protein [Mucilaginibacter polytrichastri]|nr:glycoside hydrolase family 19 protein [Mucilaginibacter polytrichastri]